MKKISDKFSSDGAKTHGAMYKAMMHLMCLKEILSETNEKDHINRYFDLVLDKKGIDVNLGSKSWSDGFIAVFDINQSEMNKVSDKYRKRVSRRIHAIDISHQTGPVRDLPDVSRRATMKVKALLAFADTFPGSSLSRNLRRRISDNYEEIMTDAFEIDDVRDSTLRGIYFGRGYHSKPDKVASSLSLNKDLQMLSSGVSRAYDDYTSNELTSQSELDKTTIQHGRNVSLWGALRNKLRNSTGSIGNRMVQGLGVVALAMLSSVSLDYSSNISYQSGFDENLHEQAVVDNAEIRDAFRMDVNSPTSALSPDIVSYTVKEGDTAWSMAKEHLQGIMDRVPGDHEVLSLLKENDLHEKDLIHKGDVLEFRVDKPESSFESNYETPGL